MQALIGLALFPFLGFIFNKNPRNISWRKVGSLLGTQIFLMMWFFYFPLMQKGFAFLAQGVTVLRNATLAGTSFVFGYLGGAPLPFAPSSGESTFIFIFQALPTIAVVGAISMLMFHWGVLNGLIRLLSGVMKPLCRIGGVLSTAMGAKLFLGQTDAPLVIKPYLNRLSRNEWFSVMVAGMATGSASLFALYASFLEAAMSSSQAIAHVVTAAIVNIPAALMMAELMVPENESLTHGEYQNPYTFQGSMDAIARGALDGWSVMWNVAAMLIVSLALVFLLNRGIGFIGWSLGNNSVTFQGILGQLMRPLVWAMGVPWSEAALAGQIMGIKMTLNEVVALARIPALSDQLQVRSIEILTYSLCSFGNFSSIAIQIGGFSVLAPERKKDIAGLAGRALWASFLAGGVSSSLCSLISSFT
jgi:CNT family concentrative nucleoside transporter